MKPAKWFLALSPLPVVAWVVVLFLGHLVVHARQVPEAQAEACAYLGAPSDPCHPRTRDVQFAMSEGCRYLVDLCHGHVWFIILDKGARDTAMDLSRVLASVSLMLVGAGVGLVFLVLLCVKAFRVVSSVASVGDHEACAKQGTPLPRDAECGTWDGFLPRTKLE